VSGGLVLRLAAPLQSWGTTGTFHHRDTAPFPTRSGLIGMFAAAQGRTRERALAPYDLPGRPRHTDLVFTCRVDRPGTVFRDFHTAGGGYGHKKGLRTATGGYRAAHKSTLVTRRDYLADAVFTIAVQGPPALLAHIADTLTTPVYSPYLGRRWCLPDEPLILHTDHPDPVHALTTAVPLSLAAPPPPGADTVPVMFVRESPPRPGTGPLAWAPDWETAAEPVDFTTTSRQHLQRPLWRTTEILPADLYAGHQPAKALADYLHPDPPAKASP
jgi:CRISPR system Cascade subunit CasD